MVGGNYGWWAYNTNYLTYGLIHRSDRIGLNLVISICLRMLRKLLALPYT